MAIKESDLYSPVCALLQRQGFVVRGEVKNCDVAALREDELWIVELKLSANLTLIYQALKRQEATDHVFIALPRPKRNKDMSMLKKLLEKLSIGLITVAMDSPLRHAEIVMFPTKNKARRNKAFEKIKKELLGRSIDTKGGTSKQKINTAFREKSIQLACLLEKKGPTSPKDLANLADEKSVYSMLRTNQYGWFVNISKGFYDITAVGRAFLEEHKTDALVIYYSMKAL